MRGPSVAVLLVASLAVRAGDARADEAEARRRFGEATRLAESGSYVEALAGYRDAYAAWSNPKILLNIGTLLRYLGRNAEAAATYELYLADATAEPAKRVDVEQALREIEAKTAKLAVQVSDTAERLLIDGRLVAESVRSAAVRLDPGPHVLVAERADGPPAVLTIAVAAGEARELTLSFPAGEEPAPLAPVPVEPVQAAPAPAPSQTVAPDRGRQERTPARSFSHAGRLGLALRADIDGKLRGAVAAAGPTLGVGDRIELSLSGLLGSQAGVEPAIDLFVLTGSLKPMLTFALPTFFADGPRPGVRGALGLEWDQSATFGAFAQTGVAWFPKLPERYETTVFVASVGVRGRL